MCTCGHMVRVVVPLAASTPRALRAALHAHAHARTYPAEVREPCLAVGFAVGDEQVDVGRELSSCGVGPVAKLALHILEAHGLVHTHTHTMYTGNA